MTDFDGKCLIADVNTDSYIYHVQLDMLGGYNCKLDLEIWSLSLWLFLFLQWCFFLFTIYYIFKTVIILDNVDGAQILMNPYYSWGIIMTDSISWTLRKKLRHWRNLSGLVKTVISRESLLYILFICF